MHDLTSVREFSRTQLEQLWLVAAGWYSAKLRGRTPSLHRIATIDTPRDVAPALAAQVAIEAVATHRLTLPGAAHTIDVSGVVDLTVVFNDAAAPPGAPALRIGPEADAVIETLAFALRHLLAGGVWKHAQADLRQLPPPLVAQLYALAEYFPLTLLTDTPNPQRVSAGTIQVVASDATSMSASGIRAADNTHAHTQTFHTDAPSLLLLAATWCGVLEILGAHPALG